MGYKAQDYMAILSLNPNGNPSLELNNITFFMKECQKLGDDVPVTWSATALTKNLDLNAVCHTLVCLVKFFEKKAQEGSSQYFTGPFLKLNEHHHSKHKRRTAGSVIESLKEASVDFVLDRLHHELHRQEPKYIPTLASLLKIKDEEWCKEFGSRGGIQLIGRLINRLNYVYKTQKHRFIQGNYVHCLSTLVEKDIFDPFIEDFSIATHLAALLNKKETIVVRKYILDIFSALCNYSEEGFWIVLNAFTEISKAEQSSHMFENLVTSLETQRDDLYRSKVLYFINSLVNSPADSFVRNYLRRKFAELDLDDVVESIEGNDVFTTHIEEQLKERIKEYNEQVKKLEIDIQSTSFSDIQDPTTMLKFLFIEMGSKSNGIEYLLEAMKRRRSPSKRSSSPPSTTSVSSPSSNEAKLQTEVKMIQKLVKSQKQKLDKLKEQVKKSEEFLHTKYVLTVEEAKSMDAVQINHTKGELLKSLRILKEREREAEELTKNYYMHEE